MSSINYYSDDLKPIRHCQFSDGMIIYTESPPGIEVWPRIKHYTAT